MKSLKLRPVSSRVAASILALFLPCALAAAAEPASDGPRADTVSPFSEEPSTDGAAVRIEPELEAAVRLHGETAVLIDFGARPDLSPALAMDWEARGRFVVAELQSAAEQSQTRVRAYLDGKGLPYRSFWIDNLIFVPSVSRGVLDDLLAFGEVEILRADRTMMVIEPVERSEAPGGGRFVEPNITHVHADQVWSQGVDGTGMVVAGIDTGVRYTHEVLLPHYRGNLGGGVYDHDFNWLDGADGSASAPLDDHGHGSHTMGTMIGDDGGANQVGMAPGATWIACDGCEGSSCSASGLLTCAQWVAAPYPIGDPSSADPSKRPHVVNNSWGDCGRSYDNWYQGVVDSWHAAGVYPVFANVNASNCGYAYPPGCNTVGNPGRYGNVTGVGSTGQSNGAYAAHSNWGPTDNLDTVNPNGFPSVKPQVVAPGVDIRSSLNSSNSSYGSWGGTSMSAPHVAGLIALMWQAAPCLIGDYAETENIIQASAVPIPYVTNCGGEGPGNIPNMATGWGEIDALEAVTQSALYCNSAWVVFIDGFENGGTSAWSATRP
jgi:subtilisin family serine protease